MDKPTNLQSRVAANLKRIRREQGLTQETVAELGNVNYRYYVSLENGHVNMTLGTLERIATALGVDPGELFAINSAREEQAGQPVS